MSTSPLESTGTRRIDWPAALAQADRWLRAVLYARLGESHAVDETIQEIALAAVQPGAVADPAKVSPWLYRLAVRQALLYRRRAGRRRKLQDRVAERETAVESPDPLDWLMAREKSRLIRDSLNGLPPRDAEVLLLKYQEGWSYAEIAERLGVSRRAVESRLHRARQKLRGRLSAAGVIEVNT